MVISSEQIEASQDLHTLVASIPSYSLTSFNVRSPQEVLDILDKQLSKIYSPRAEDLKSIYNASGRISQTFQNVQDKYCLVQDNQSSKEQRPSQKPLYSDILMNEAGSLYCNDSRFDELEQEAMEQYSGSDMMLLVNLNTLKESPTRPQDVTHEDVRVAQDQFCSKSTSLSQNLSLTRSKDGTRRQVRQADPVPSQASSASRSSRCSGSPVAGFKRLSGTSSLSKDCIPNKQALWMEKKKKKIERKKRLSKRNRNKCNKTSVELVEKEIFLISLFTEMSNKFLKYFFESKWKVVVAQLEADAFESFEECLQITEDCLYWFKSLIMSKELKKDLIVNNKRLDFSNSLLEILNLIFDLLHQYIYHCSKIKSTIPFDHRLYFDSNKHHRLPLGSCEYFTNKHIEEDIFIQSYFVFDNLLCSLISQHYCFEPNHTCGNRGEWKLNPESVKSYKRRQACVRFTDSERGFNFILEHKNEPDSKTCNKWLKIVDSFPIWSEHQWIFHEGWMFNSNSLYYSFNWLNKFNADSLIELASFTRSMYIMKNWTLYSTEAVFSNKFYSPQHQLLWSVAGYELMSSKVAYSVEVMVREKKGWCLGVLWISKEPCNPWQPFCESACCIGYDMSCGGGVKSAGKSETPNADVQEYAATSLNRDHTMEDEVKIKRCPEISKSMISNKLFGNKQTASNKVVERKVNLPQEKNQSLCLLQ